MKINGNLESSPLGKPSTGKASGAAKSEKAGAASASEGTVSLSSTGLAAAKDTGAPFNAAKVEEIKNAISSGRFTVNSGAVADGILRDAQELAGRRKG